MINIDQGSQQANKNTSKHWKYDYTTHLLNDVLKKICIEWSTLLVSVLVLVLVSFFRPYPALSDRYVGMSSIRFTVLEFVIRHNCFHFSGNYVCSLKPSSYWFVYMCWNACIHIHSHCNSGSIYRGDCIVVSLRPVALNLFWVLDLPPVGKTYFALL